jgi:ribosome recycling factor
MHSTYYKNRLRRARRDALDGIKLMKLPEDDEKKEREVVEKTLAQVIARIICPAASRRRCFSPLRNALASHAPWRST